MIFGVASKTAAPLPGPLLERESFESLREVIGEGFSALMQSHLATMRDYVGTVRRGFNSGDYLTMANAAHPLKSTSELLGAFGFATLADEIEQQGESPKPDLKLLKDLVLQLEEMQPKLEKEIINAT